MYSQQKSLNFGNYIPSDKSLNKRVPENPKYRDVKAAVYTGRNVNRQVDELKEKHKNCNQRKDEVFKRIKMSAFIKLAINIAKSHLQDNIKDGYNELISSEVVKNTSMANVLVGIGEIDLQNEKKKAPVVLPKRENCGLYLLLDVRDRDDFLKSHIKTAKHYPAALLSRSIGYETEDLKVFKNKVHHLIVLYDDDETISNRVATTLVQRGYNNVYMISGGLKLAQETFPCSLMAAIAAVPSSNGVLDTSSAVQIKTVTPEYFSEEDIDIIQQYVEDFRNKDSYPVHRSTKFVLASKSNQSISEVDNPSIVTEYTQPIQGSLTYRKGSATSVKSSDKSQLGSAMGSVITASGVRGISAKKAPWK